MTNETDRSKIAAAARILARLGFVHAFGHVSGRVGERVLISPTRPALLTLGEEDLIDVGESRADRLPIETPLHVAIYRRRPDVNAICRTHSPAVSVCGLFPPPPVLHGFGGMVGAEIGRWTGFDLVARRDQAEGAADALGSAGALLLSGNGGLAVGGDVGEALVNAWSLEERCRVALAAGDRAYPVAAEELAERTRWYPTERVRTLAWLVTAYGDESARLVLSP